MTTENTDVKIKLDPANVGFKVINVLSNNKVKRLNKADLQTNLIQAYSSIKEQGEWISTLTTIISNIKEIIDEGKGKNWFYWLSNGKRIFLVVKEAIDLIKEDARWPSIGENSQEQ